jgi:hypothetical protein
MSKMGTFFIEQTYRQFGDELPAMSDPCCLCGQPYGEHEGLNCPEEISFTPYQAKFMINIIHRLTRRLNDKG